MTSKERKLIQDLKRQIDLLEKQRSTAIDKELLLLNQVIALQDENRTLRLLAQAAA
ncbi:hypothetical protein VPH49_26380 [Pseudomonas luteola]|uniref:hypothetical protein n=1 Tax=Pseudomonas luteola TaxID=47886 RepID=UPI003A84199D